MDCSNASYSFLDHMSQPMHPKNSKKPIGPPDRNQRRPAPRKKAHQNENEEEQALIFNEHSENNQEQSQDVMNVTFNRSSEATHNFFGGAQSPKTSEYPDDFFNVEKKDSLKLSSGEYEAFDQIKEARVKKRESETKMEVKSEKKRK
jgi:hypothetical protein